MQGPVKNAKNCKQFQQVGMLIPTFSRQGPAIISSGPHPTPAEHFQTVASAFQVHGARPGVIPGMRVVDMGMIFLGLLVVVVYN